MSAHYEEIIKGEVYLRQPPGIRHEHVLRRLHDRLASSLRTIPTAKILEIRSIHQLTAGSLLRPDLTLVNAATDRLILAVEVIDANDHRLDTVDKKELYETCNVPRLWIVDPRYDNVEVYYGSPHGLRLNRILAGKEILTEPFLPGFTFPILELFAE
jgi:Uma2 family endonuclease